MVKHRLITYSENLLTHIVLSVSQLPDIAQRTACTQNVPLDVTFYLSTSSLLCNIKQLRCRRNITEYQLLRIGYEAKFDYFDTLIPGILLPESQLPDIAKKTTCTQNIPMDVTFDLR